MIDYVAISGEKDSKRIEYVDHLHEHFVGPCVVQNGGYVAPSAPGFSIEMKQSTILPVGSGRLVNVRIPG